MKRNPIKFGDLVLATNLNKAGYVVEACRNFCIVKFGDGSVEIVGRPALRRLGD